MGKNNVSVNHRITPAPQYFTGEEQAVIASAGSEFLSKLFAAVWRIKLRLQFTGWLQYMLPVVAALPFFVVAILAGSQGSWSVAALLGGVAAGLMVMFVFDLITVKFRLHPAERLPQRKDTMNLFDVMRSRRSCRSFQPRRMTPADLAELTDVVRMYSEAPRIGTSAVRFEYVAAPLTVWPTVNATEFLVAIAPRQYDRLAVIDVGRSLQKIVIAATRMGLATCWIGPGADQSSIVQHLGNRFNPQQDHIICVCAVGYKSCYIPVFLRIFNRQLYRRLPLSALFFADAALQTPLDVTAPPFSRFGRTYEVCQWSPSSYNGQTTRCVGVMGDSELPQFDFYTVTASRYYAAVALGIWCADWEMGCAALGLHGHFAVLSAEERGVQPQLDLLPRYHVSWLPEAN
ncbi:MAG: nitroreductase [Anaerolineaceae bacterium]|nr:nitroreductase [Anaerolineaceae bacterium]